MTQDAAAPSSRRRHSRALFIGISATVVVLVALRVSASYVLEWYVNNKLDESPKYAGQVGDIDLSLLRGAYTIENVEITKTEGEVPVPLFAAAKVEFSTLWRAVMNGEPVAQAELFEPQINIVDSTDESQKQTGSGGKWLQMIDDLFPLQIDRTIIHDGQLHFRNYDSDPRIDISLSSLQATASNLANRQALTDSTISRIEMKALAMDASDLTLAAAYDPAAEKPTFDVNLELLQLPILKLDNFISTYAPFDVEAGTIDISSELAAREGILDGYVRPVVHNLEVFRWSEDIGNDKDNPVRALWEGLVGFAAQLLENKSSDQLVSNIPLHGDISNTDTNIFVATAGVMKDAFAKAYQADFRKTISLLVAEEPEPVPLPPPLEQNVMPAME